MHSARCDRRGAGAIAFGLAKSGGLLVIRVSSATANDVKEIVALGNTQRFSMEFVLGMIILIFGTISVYFIKAYLDR
jgi:hypothetical protein